MTSIVGLLTLVSEGAGLGTLAGCIGDGRQALASIHLVGRLLTPVFLGFPVAQLIKTLPAMWEIHFFSALENNFIEILPVVQSVLTLGPLFLCNSVLLEWSHECFLVLHNLAKF